MGAIRLLLVDDNLQFLNTLQDFLADEEDLAIVGRATDGHEAVQQCGRLHPDVVVMDVYMPTVDGLQATRDITQHCPGSRVVVITGQEEPDLRALSREAGAVGFVVKHEAAFLLREAIREAARSGRSPGV